MNPRELYPDSKSWDLWLNDLDTKSYSTRRHYVRVFLEFLKRWDVTPEELFELKLKHVKSDDPRDHRVIEGWVKVSMNETINEGKAPSTARMIYKAVNSFFDSQNLDFNVKPREKPRMHYNGSKMIIKRQIRVLLDRVGEEHRFRNRAIILALKDSGLRVSDLETFTVEDYTTSRAIKNSADETFRILGSMETVKTGGYAYVHLGPESVDAIDTYLEDLEKNGAQVEPTDPLFRKRNGAPMTAGTMSSMIWKVADKLDRSDKISAHSLRKYFQTMLEASGVPKNWVAKYQGKTIGDSSGPYSRPEEIVNGDGRTLTDWYVQSYDALRVFGPSKQRIEEQSDRIRELEDQLENERLRNLDIRREFEDLRRDTEEQISLLKEFIKR